MKICNKCGAQVDNSTSFCPMCGTNMRASNPTYPRKEPISVGGWIGRSLIPCIPLVGGIVYLVMLFIWRGNNDKEETFRNWAKAQLIVMAVVLVLTVVLAILFGVIYSDLLSSL